MNILMLTSEFAPATGGIGTYAREIATAATELGARVTVLAPDYSKSSPDEDKSFPFELHRFHGGLHSMRNLPSKILLARNHVRIEDYDVIHAADWPFFIPLALSRHRTQARLLMTVHGTEINETQTPLKRLAIQAAGVFGPRVEVAANSRFTRELFRERFSIESERVVAIPLGVSDFWFGPRKSRKATRRAYGVDADKIVMVTVARLTRRKGHLKTLAALASLPNELRRRIAWLVIGPNGEPDFVEEFRDMVDTTDCEVHLLGSLSNEHIRDIYGASDFFCLTGIPESSGRVEGFGLVYLEAGAGGLPSVATAVGGVPDAVLADETGLLVEPDVEAIAQAITEIAEDSNTRSILAAGAAAHARSLSWERCAAETYHLPRAGERKEVKTTDNQPAREQAHSGDALPRTAVAGRR
ncbi:glycosyltransferase involved in cell wall biosynthesis [Afipia massiliensis]|uniref:Glycosyltransferase involved in cell wall biosynthesis n=1 Tax=Afipia massiliensis TaxID=211460 RepID=A0A840N4P1_9BRAD|nr:glycosyltransferase family 4 protein [Afipia massiliensis]MBB5053872.1 glycosyltransferase involved in cell wall biosynthesis [Afipia massiliensis]